jgi:hypothetical protein
MIYLTNDTLNQAVYFSLRSNEPRRKGGVEERLVRGLLGNGITEVPVTVRSRKDYQEMVFGGEEIFNLVEERTIRKMIGELVREMNH